MSDASDIAIEILKPIRDGVSTTNQRLESTNQRLESVDRRLMSVEGRLETVEHAVVQTNERMGVVEAAVLELARQQRFVVRALRVVGERDHRLADDVDELRARASTRSRSG